MQMLGDRRDAGGRGSETGARVAVKAVGGGQRGGQGETWKGVPGSAPCDRIPLPGRLQGHTSTVSQCLGPGAGLGSQPGWVRL